jgi:hypothetical protein
VLVSAVLVHLGQFNHLGGVLARGHCGFFMALLFNTHSAKSKEKLNRFFGEQLQISVGGSVEKLNSYYVQGEAAEARKRNSISTIDELLASPLLESPAIQNTSLSFASLNDDSRKARQILGDVVMDTSLAKIHSDGLSALYSSHFPLCYFLAFLLAEQSCEVLFFRMDVVNFEQMVFKSVKQMHSTAQAIFDSYLAQDSVLEINVSEKTKRAVNQSINAYSSTCFHPALLELQPGLETLFKRFLSSSQYDEMASQIRNWHLM